MHLRPFMSNEVVFNTTTKELRRGPGMWPALKPFVSTVEDNVAVRVVVTTNITIATGLNNGDSAGGVTLATGDDVLLIGQTDATQNGVYRVAASPARTTGRTTIAGLAGQLVRVTAGTGAGRYYLNTNVAADEVGTSDITFARFGLGPLNLEAVSPLDVLPTVTPLGTDLVLVQRADGSLAKATLTAIGTLVNV